MRLAAIRDAAEQAQRHQQLAEDASGDERTKHLAAARAHLAAIEAMARAEREGMR